MKLTKKDITALEKLGWKVEKNGLWLFLENYSPAGGDMVIECQTKEQIIEYCDNYDADDEFKCWYGVGKGEPSTPSELWNDCVEKGNMYRAVKEALQK